MVAPVLHEAGTGREAIGILRPVPGIFIIACVDKGIGLASERNPVTVAVQLRISIMIRERSVVR